MKGDNRFLIFLAIATLVTTSISLFVPRIGADTKKVLSSNPDPTICTHPSLKNNSRVSFYWNKDSKLMVMCRECQEKLLVKAERDGTIGIEDKK